MWNKASPNKVPIQLGPNIFDTKAAVGGTVDKYVTPSRAEKIRKVTSVFGEIKKTRTINALLK